MKRNILYFLAVLLTVGLTGLPSRWLAGLNHRIYDALLSALPHTAAGPLLTVEIPEKAWQAPILDAAIDWLAPQVNEIVLVGPPLPLRQSLEKLLIGTPAAWQDHAWHVPERLDGTVVHPVVIPLSQGGIHRGLPTRLETQHGTQALLHTHLAERQGRTLPEANYLIDFRVPGDELQRIDGQRLLDRALPASLLDGRTVLLVPKAFAAAAVTTPRHRGGDALSPYLFYAATLDASLRSGIIRPYATPWTWLVALLLGATWLITICLRPQIKVYWIALALFAVVLAGTWIALGVFGTWFPPTQVFILLGGFGLVETFVRKREDESTLQASLLALSTEVRERADQAELFTGTTLWPLLQRLIAQLFDLEDSILIQSHAADRTLLAALPEHEDTFHRLFGTGPIVESDLNEVSGVTMLPLPGVNRDFGYWAFNLPEKIDSQDSQDILRDAQLLATHMGHVLELRQRWLERGTPAVSAAERTQRLPEQLAASIQLLEQSRDTLARALNRSREAVLVFNAFGQLLHQSASSIELLAPIGLDLQNTDPLKLLHTLSRADDALLRQTLSVVMLQQQESTVMAHPDLLPGRRFLIRLRPVENPPGGNGARIPQLPGLVVLIQDVTQLERAAFLKDELVERIIFQLNNDFLSLTVAADLLEDPQLGPDERTEITSMISEKVEQSSALLRDARSFLQEAFTPAPVECYPVRTLPVIEAALASLAEQIALQRIEVKRELPDYCRLALASPDPLEQLLAALLRILVDDAREESCLNIHVVDINGHVEITLSNQGFGMPAELLEKHLASPTSDIEEFRLVATGQAHVREWGGELGAHSKLQEGMSFKLSLRAIV